VTAEAAMLALLLERGVCAQTSTFQVGEQKVIVMRCNDDRPAIRGWTPYRVPGHDRG
jgi:hypothetical protein